MWRHEHVGVRQEGIVSVRRLCFKDIERSACNAARVQSVNQCRFINDRPSCGIDEVGARPHGMERFGIDQVARFVIERRVQGQLV